MTFGIIEKGEPLLTELIVLAFESAGHYCLVFKDADHATRALQTTHVDSIVLSIHMPGQNGVDWLESMATHWPDLPSRTLLLTGTGLTPDEAARITRLGAEVAFRPFSLVGIELVVIARLRKAGCESAGPSPHRREPAIPAELLN